MTSTDTATDTQPDAVTRRPLGGADARRVEPGPPANPFTDLAPSATSMEAADREGADDAAPAAGSHGVPRLYGTPSNPVPPGAVPGTVRTGDGLTLRTAIFPAAARPRLGTIVLLQGRNECIEKYFETARDLTALGHAVLAFDWRGQGGSERLLRDPMKGHVPSFRHYERDLAAVASSVLPDMRPPFTLVGHSKGALLGMLAAADPPEGVERVVALAPLLRLVDQPIGHRGLKWATAVLRALGLGRLYAAGGPRRPEIPDFLTNVLTTDPARHERNGEMFLQHPHLGIGGPTVAWTHAAMVAMDRMHRERTLRGVRVPSLLIAAGDDQVVSTPAQERIVRRMRNANVLTVDGARHELLQERDRYREQVIAAIHAFAARPEPSTSNADAVLPDETTPDAATPSDPVAAA